MKVNNNPHVILFDVDDNLVDFLFNEEHENKEVIVVNGQRLLPVKLTVERLKLHSNQGHYVIVQSTSGSEWAEKVVKALELEDYVNEVQTKPKFYYDDEDANKWMVRIPPKKD